MTTAGPRQPPNAKPTARPFIVPVFIPHAGCPHQCVFCNQSVITGSPNTRPAKASIAATIEQFLSYRRTHHAPPQISFYGGNFLGLKRTLLLELLQLARGYVDRGMAESIRFSTRPDTVTQTSLDLLRPFPVKTIELGVQSMDDRVLRRTLRGHTAHDTRKGIQRLKKRGYTVGLQMMIGLPGQTAASALATARQIARFSPRFVRIYPTVVLENSRLEKWFRKGSYLPLSLEEAVEQAKSIYRHFQARKIPVIRMGLQASDGLDMNGAVVAGPYHPSFGHLVLSAIFLEKAERLLKNTHPLTRHITVCVHSRNISRIRGMKNDNIRKLKKRFGLETLDVLADNTLSDQDIHLKT